MPNPVQVPVKSSEQAKKFKQPRQSVVQVPAEIPAEVPAVSEPVSESVSGVAGSVSEVSEVTEVSESVPDAPQADLGSQIDTLRALVAGLEKGLSEKVKAFKSIEQELKKISVAYRKESKRKYKKTKTGASTSHGFNASVSISKQLADFLGVAEDTKFRRPEVTILISDYAKTNGLKNPENKGIYLPDEKLTALFGPPIYPLRSDKSVNGYDMFNLQKYMKPHFEKKE